MADATVLDRATEGSRRAQALQQLYGKSVLPDALLNVFNGDITTCQQITAGMRIRGVVAGEMYAILHKFILRVEDKPVVTRFWLFSDCVFGLLRIGLLELPIKDILRLSTTHPRLENQRRIRAVEKYLCHKNTLVELKRVSLALRLSMLATNIAGLKRVSATVGEPEPVLLRLARGDVLRRVSEELAATVRNLHCDASLQGADLGTERPLVFLIER